MTDAPGPGAGREPSGEAWPEEDLRPRQAPAQPPAAHEPPDGSGPSVLPQPRASPPEPTAAHPAPPPEPTAAHPAPPPEPAAANPAASPEPTAAHPAPPPEAAAANPAASSHLAAPPRRQRRLLRLFDLTVRRPVHLAIVPWRRVQRRFPWLSLQSRRGKLLAVFLVAGFASALTVGGVIAVSWTETADFCGRCHTMGPELKAHAISPHQELACAECHVEPGVAGWIKAKLNGTRQLIQLVTNTFPTPIPPPGHGDLPPTSDTCRRCHDVTELVKNDGPVRLVLRNQYQDDEANTKTSVALVLRPAGFGATSATRGVHWHVDLDVEYSTTDRRSQSIDVVTVTDKAGKTTQYVAAKRVTQAAKAQDAINTLVAENPLQRMDCIDCHNRIGHRVPSLNEAIDNAMDIGTVSPSLPYIKKEAMSVLSAEYETTDEADQAIDGIATFYKAKYPIVTTGKSATLQGAIDELKEIYELVATPEMRVSASTYPDNLGHQNYPGCFRCHDGAHFKVVNGTVTKDTIPSSCATCHTFPQVGTETSTFLIGQRPDTHTDRLWLFNHKTLAKTTDASSNACGACHTQTYCDNCHNSPAINVPHDDMVFTHPAVIRKVGSTSCALCHQPSSCERCHPAGISLTGAAQPGASGASGGTAGTSTAPVATPRPGSSVLARPSPSSLLISSPRAFSSP